MCDSSLLWKKNVFREDLCWKEKKYNRFSLKVVVLLSSIWLKEQWSSTVSVSDLNHHTLYIFNKVFSI